LILCPCESKKEDSQAHHGKRKARSASFATLTAPKNNEKVRERFWLKTDSFFLFLQGALKSAAADPEKMSGKRENMKKCTKIKPIFL